MTETQKVEKNAMQATDGGALEVPSNRSFLQKIFGEKYPLLKATAATGVLTTSLVTFQLVSPVARLINSVSNAADKTAAAADAVKDVADKANEKIDRINSGDLDDAKKLGHESRKLHDAFKRGWDLEGNKAEQMKKNPTLFGKPFAAHSADEFIDILNTEAQEYKGRDHLVDILANDLREVKFEIHLLKTMFTGSSDQAKLMKIEDHVDVLLKDAEQRWSAFVNRGGLLPSDRAPN